MKKWMIFLGALCLGLSVAACAGASSSIDYPSGTWRYKMTVEVETPEGVKTGFAVREIVATSRPEMLAEGNDTHMRLAKGEAVVVNLGSRGMLFVLLGNADDPIETFLEAFPSGCAEGRISRCAIRYYNSLKLGSSAMVPPDKYPMIVTFQNLKDPASVLNLRPYKLCPDPNGSGYKKVRCIDKDRTTEVFGIGVKIKSITVETTQDEVGMTMHTILPWLADYYAKRLDGERFGTAESENKFANELSSGSFSTGEMK